MILAYLKVGHVSRHSDAHESRKQERRVSLDLFKDLEESIVIQWINTTLGFVERSGIRDQGSGIKDQGSEMGGTHILPPRR